MKSKSGKAVKAVEPTEPEEAFAADEAKPGDAAKIKAKQLENKKGKYGATKAPAFKPAPEETSDSEEETEEETSWIEIELLDEESNPVAGEKYEIELPDGKMAKGTLDNKGIARVEGIKPGNCKVNFPEFDKKAWS